MTIRARRLRQEGRLRRLLGDASATELAESDCWSLLRSGRVGRLALLGPQGIEIFPVNYLIADRSIVFRSAPGEKMHLLTGGASVAFEVDGSLRRHRWSVVAHGTARRLDVDAEIEETGILELRPDHPHRRMWNYVRITPDRVTGRLFRSRGPRGAL